MRQPFLKLFSLLLIVSCWASLIVQAQVSSSLSGVITDPNGAVIQGAVVTVKQDATGQEFKVTTSTGGNFTLPSMSVGTYTVSVTAQGFKTAVVQGVEINAGTPANVNVALEIGGANETVTVQGGAEIVQSQTANITTTVQAGQILNLPLVSRNPVNFVSLMAGVNTPRDVRNSTINGLPESAIDITLDGINVQDNFNKTGDGLFVRVAPTLDSIEEVTVSTATPEAAGGAMGAVQVKFVTRQGGNEFHGSLYEYHRNTALNSAYWFTNRDAQPYNVATAKNCVNGTNTVTGAPGPTPVAINPATQELYTPENCRAQRAANLFHQFGGRIGGPITIPGLFSGKNKAFFFVNYEEFRQPTQVVRQRTILHPDAQGGLFRYGTGANARAVNLFTVAAAAGQTATPDPTIAKLLSDIRAATGGNGITALTDPNQQRFTYNPSGNALTKRPTVRFDVNVTANHRVEATWTYQMGRGGPDFLNNVEPAFPGFPNQGNQPADRYTGSVALRSTLTPSLVNEARTGLSGGPSRFNPAATASTYSGSVANQNGFALNMNGAFGITNAHVVNAPSRRNPLFRDVSDTLTWTRNAHTLVFGGKLIDTQLTYNAQTLVPTISFGVDTNDPAIAMFNTTNFPNAAAADLTRAQNLYAVLTGRVTAIAANARLVEKDGKYVYLGNAFERSHQKEFGFFVQDSWRVRQNLTVNYGVRWEVQRPFTVDNSSYTTATLEDVWGISGPGNLFKPGTMTGRTTQFIQMKDGTPAYNTDYKNFAPSLGFAWRITGQDGFLKRIVGDGQTVIRAGYSIAYNRQGIGDFRGLQSANPGLIITADRNLTIGNLVTNTGTDRLPVLLRETSRLGPPAFTNTPTYPLTGAPFVAVTNSVNVYDPNIKVPYSQSWTFGLQRELDRNTVFEARYVGTRNLRGWTTYNLNAVENNIAENGLLAEFRLAQANLAANIAAGRGSNFRYFGPNTGTNPLPITLAYFSGRPAAQAGTAANYSSSNFASNTFVNTLARNNPLPGTYAANLDAQATFRANAITAGLPANFMLTNPGLRGGANFTGNGGYTRYDALQMEVRRRLSAGVSVQANYQFGRTFESSRVSFRAPRVNIQDTNTLLHSFKVAWGYELPFGRGKAFLGGVGNVMDRIVGGWEFYGSGRVQSGQLFNFGNVSLVGMTRKELNDVFKLRFDDVNRIAYLLPQDIIDNTIRAFNASATSATGYGTLGVPTGRYIAPANGPNCLQVFSGQCAPQNVFVTGPKFTRFDLSVKKQIRITEKTNFELRAEFLNAFNNINFFNPTAAAFTNPVNQTFMQVTTAYTDASNTNDPGGRLVQIVARFNF